MFTRYFDLRRTFSSGTTRYGRTTGRAEKKNPKLFRLDGAGGDLGRVRINPENDHVSYRFSPLFRELSSSARTSLQAIMELSKIAQNLIKSVASGEVGNAIACLFSEKSCSFTCLPDTS